MSALITKVPTLSNNPAPERNPNLSLRSSFATDANLEQAGVIVIYPDAQRGEPQAYRIRLRRLGGRNSLYTKVKERLMRPYRNVEWKDLPEKTQTDISVRMFVEGAIASWETKHYDGCITKLTPNADGWLQGVEVGQEDGTDEILPATVDNIIAALKQVPDFMEVLFSECRGPDLFRQEQRDAASKN